MPLSRRQFGALGALSLPALLAPRPARAAAGDRKFVFVHAYGGWDVTRVFAPAFDNPLVDMETKASPATSGGIPWVDCPERPSVRQFMDAWHDRTLVWNGISVPSVGHIECVRLMLTGDTTGLSADWATLLAAAAADRFPLPHVLLNGPQFPGTWGSLVTRIGTSGSARALLDGTVVSEAGHALPSTARQALLDVHLSGRGAARTPRGARHAALLLGGDSAHERARALEGYVDALRWPEDSSLSAQIAFAIDLLRLDASRCVTLAYDRLETWDSHADNDVKQSTNFEALFAGLVELMTALESTPGTTAPTLADETVVVVLSEMARTPQLNGGAGKDHWGTTSAMLVGPGVAGDRVIGGYGEYFYAEAIAPSDGSIDPEGLFVAGGEVGATLLALGDVDPAEALPDHTVVEGALAE